MGVYVPDEAHMKLVFNTSYNTKMLEEQIGKLKERIDQKEALLEKRWHIFGKMPLDTKAEVDGATVIAQYVYFCLVDLTVDRRAMLMLSSAKPVEKRMKVKKVGKPSKHRYPDSVASRRSRDSRRSRGSTGSRRSVGSRRSRGSYEFPPSPNSMSSRESIHRRQRDDEEQEFVLNHLGRAIQLVEVRQDLILEHIPWMGREIGHHLPWRVGHSDSQYSYIYDDDVYVSAIRPPSNHYLPQAYTSGRQ